MIEITPNPPGKRFADAHEIQKGAVNPSGIARALVAACAECLDAGADQRRDPAVRLIVHQLAYLCDIDEINRELGVYGYLLKICEEQAK